MGDAYYRSTVLRVVEIHRAAVRGWREPQVGAIAACLSHSTRSAGPAVISMPTGSGKTAVELAVAHVLAPRRVLVLVPSVLLREQLARGFREQSVLREMLVLEDPDNPKVIELTGLGLSVGDLQAADVVVAIPQTLASFVDASAGLPPDLFDLVIVDEAHHVPAATWTSVLKYFSSARSFLFTATPRRRDGKRLPGVLGYHYPVRRAIDSGLLNPIDALLVGDDVEDKDEGIVDHVMAVRARPGYEEVPVLARVATIARAEHIVELYRKRGMTAETYHSKLAVGARENRLAGWRALRTSVLVGVDAFGEGVDYPDLRVLAYHDKHKSEAATVQQIGRLARTSRRFDVRSVVVARAGGEEYPALRGALVALYREDADWSHLLPSLIDDVIEQEAELAEFVQGFDGTSPNVELASLRPLGVVELREAPAREEFAPTYVANGAVPAPLELDETVLGYRVSLARLSDDHRSLYLCFWRWAVPKWSSDERLTALESHLCIVTWHTDPNGVQTPVLAVSATDDRLKNYVLGVVDPDGELRLPDVERLQRVVDGLEWTSVSNVGVRSTSSAGSGVQYANYAGRGVDRGLGESTMGQKALGHAMIQIAGEGRSINAGIAVEKGKYWELRHMSVLEYWDWVTWLVSRYWDPTDSAGARLVPALARGARLVPPVDARVFYAEMDHRCVGEGWRTVDEGIPLFDLEISCEVLGDSFYYTLSDPTTAEVFWQGQQVVGSLTVLSEDDLLVDRGGGNSLSLAELFSRFPPTIVLTDGRLVRGAVVYDRPRGSRLRDSSFVESWEWPDGTNIKSEVGTRLGWEPGPDSVQRAVWAALVGAAIGKRRRWVFYNDGSKEIADFVVVELADDDIPGVELWHVKASGSSKPGLAEKHFEELGQQAMKSRRWLVSETLWTTLAKRLDDVKPGGPRLHHIGGGELDDFRALVGRKPAAGIPDLSKHPTVVRGEVIAVQPGLSKRALDEALGRSDAGADQALVDVLAHTRQVVRDSATFRVVASA